MFNWLKLRPTFDATILVSRQAAIEQLANAYQKYAQPKIFFVHGEYGELHLPTEQHRLWSPHLSFYVCEEGEQTIVRGRFAPRLEIWTLVWILYLAMAFTAFFSLAMAFSMNAIGETTWWHWAGGAALVAIVLIYVVANVGQQWSSDQMDQLREQLFQILTEAGVMK